VTAVHAPAFLPQLVLVFLAALASAYLLSRLRQPPLIGFLIAGVLLGPFGLGVEGDVQAVNSLADVGVVLLLFMVGLELELPNLKRLGRIVWLAGPIQVIATIALVAAVGLLAGYEPRRAVFFGFLVALSSTAIVLTLLTDRREIDAPHGRLLLGILIFQDLAVVPMMLAVPALAGGAGKGLPAALVALGKTAATGVLLVLGARFLVPRLLHALAETREKAIFVVAVLFLVLGTALAASWAGLSAALGAFLAGLVISESDYGHQAMSDIAPFRDAFNALFFVSIGMLFDPRFLLREPLLVGALLVLIVVGKAGFGALPVAILRYGPRPAIIVGLSLAQIGEFSFVLLKQGKSFNLIADNLYQAFLGAAIISMAATPWLSEWSHAAAARISRGVAPALRHPTREPELPSEGHVLVFGFGHMGETLSRVLARAKVPFRVLDLNPERVRKGKAKSVPIQYGDTTSASVLKHAGVERARAAIALLSDPRGTRQTLSLCRQLAPRIFLLARTRYLAEIPELSALGADEVVAEEFETALEISGRALRRLGFPLPWVESETEEIRRSREDSFRRFRAPDVAAERLEEALPGIRIEFVSIGPDWRAIGRTLRELDLRAAGGAIVLAVVREEHALVTPGADFALEGNDRLLLLGTDAALERTLDLLRGTGETITAS
jgi:CPA2 family monovalent cation:H+ antiporter-2